MAISLPPHSHLHTKNNHTHYSSPSLTLSTVTLEVKECLRQPEMELRSVRGMGETEYLLPVFRDKDIISIPPCPVKLRTQLRISKEMGKGSFFAINTLNSEFYDETPEGPGAKFGRGLRHRCWNGGSSSSQMLSLIHI